MSAEDTSLLDPGLEEQLRRGLALLAEQTPPPRSRRPRLLAAAAAFAVVASSAAGIGFAMTRGGDAPTPHQAGPRPTTPARSGPTLGGPPPIAQGVVYDLPRLVRESTRIVIGTVDSVEQHPASDASGGIDYVLATVSVDRALRGPATDHVVAFDYDYGITTSGDGMGATFTQGQRVLLFLADVTGTVNESIRPEHWQVTGGAAGLYPMHGDEPEASFTIADVQREVDG